jgi:tetratricopeptide (TPR) repeat protein
MKNIFSAFFSVSTLVFLAANTLAQNTNIDAIYSKAETLLYKDNNYMAAVATAQEGLKLNEQHKGLKTILAIAQYKSGNKPVAHKLFDDLVRQHDDDVNLKVEYAHLIEKENKQKAFRIYESVLEKDADNLKALFFTGQYYTDAASEKLNSGGSQQEVFSLMTKGIECFERYHKLKPEDKTVVESLIQFYESLRMYDKATEMKKKL